jgi:hypothetical protein
LSGLYLKGNRVFPDNRYWDGSCGRHLGEEGVLKKGQGSSDLSGILCGTSAVIFVEVKYAAKGDYRICRGSN